MYYASCGYYRDCWIFKGQCFLSTGGDQVLPAEPFVWFGKVASVVVVSIKATCEPIGTIEVNRYSLLVRMSKVCQSNNNKKKKTHYNLDLI